MSDVIDENNEYQISHVQTVHIVLSISKMIVWHTQRIDIYHLTHAMMRKINRDYEYECKKDSL